MSYEHILVDREDGVGIVTLNRPDKLNAMNRKLGSELHDAVKRLEADDAVGCIVLTGAGRAFSAGGDIHEQLEDDSRYSDEELDRMRTRRGYLDISMSKKPTIGMMNGLAFGGAAVIASSLDMRIGCEDTKFRFLAAAYGRINSTWTLPNQVGWPIAKELLFSARIVEAEEAHRIGLLNRLVPVETAAADTMAFAQRLAAGPPRVHAWVKRAVYGSLDGTLEQALAVEHRGQTELLASRDFFEGVSAFFQKRAPEFTGE